MRLIISLLVIAMSRPGLSQPPQINTVPTVDERATQASTTATISDRMLTQQAMRAAKETSRPATTSPQAALTAQAPTDPATTTILATFKGGELTNHDLRRILTLRKPIGLRAPVEDIMKYPPEQLRDVVKDIAYEQVIYEKAKAAGITAETTAIAEKLADYRTRLLQKIFAEKVIGPRVQKKNEESARQIYEEEKEEKYIVPEQFLLKELFLAKHNKYVVKDGDTLESIAVGVSGRKEAVHEIFYGMPLPGPAFPKPKPDEVAPPVKLRAGEELLVPLSREEMTSKSRLASDLQKRAVAGEDFDALIEKHSELPVPEARHAPFVGDFERWDPEVEAAVRSAHKQGTSATKVLDLSFGLHIIKIGDYVTTTPIPFEKVKETILIEQTERDRNFEQARREAYGELRERYKITINTEALKREDYAGENPLQANTVIASGPDFEYTLDEFRRDMLPTMKSWTGLTYDQRLLVAQYAPEINAKLVEHEAERLKLTELPEFREEMESKEIIEVTAAYIARESAEQVEVKRDDLRKYYEENVERYTSPPLATVREITRRIDLGKLPEQRQQDIQKAKQELNALRQQIKSQDDFERIARRESQALSTRSRGGLIGTMPMDFRGASFKNQLLQLQPGEVSEPFLYGSEVMIIRLDGLRKAAVQGFEEVLPRVLADYRREVVPKLKNKAREEALEEAGFKLLF